MDATRRRLLAAALVAPCAGIFAAFAQDAALANGVFLVAKPDLPDPNFRETVVLITQPDAASGPLGVIINRPLAARLSDAMPGIGVIPELSNQIYGGGPVARNRVLFLVRSREPAPRSLQVLDDVYLTGDPELPAKIARGDLKADSYRAFVGYSGWAPRQLQAEIAAGGWYLTPADADMIFAVDASSVWPAMIKRVTTLTTRRSPDVIIEV
jgi:putative transcriptional regulator